RRWTDAPAWARYAGPGHWNDLDSVEVGNGDRDGLTPDERRSVVTFWSIEAAPLLLGTVLTTFVPGVPDLLRRGLFNLGTEQAAVSADWAQLGLGHSV